MSSSTEILDMAAAVEPGNWDWISKVAALYSKRNNKSVYLKFNHLIINK